MAKCLPLFQKKEYRFKDFIFFYLCFFFSCFECLLQKRTVHGEHFPFFFSTESFILDNFDKERFP